MIGWNDVVALASELSTVDQAGQDVILSYVNEEINTSYFRSASSPKLRLARIYLAAHLATVASSKGAVGPLASEKVGEISRSWVTQATLDSTSLTTTSYGRAYRDLIRSTKARFFVI